VGNALFVSPANAAKWGKQGKRVPAGMAALGQLAAKQKSVQQANQALQSLQHAQQVQALQQKVQQIQQLVAAQHKHVQNIQKMQAAPTSVPPPHPSLSTPSASQYLAKVNSAISKLKGHHHPSQAAASHNGVKHQAATAGPNGHQQNQAGAPSQYHAKLQVLVARLKGQHNHHQGAAATSYPAKLQSVMAKLKGHHHWKRATTTTTANAPAAPPAAKASTSATSNAGTTLSTLQVAQVVVPSAPLITGQLGGSGGSSSQSTGTADGPGLTGAMGLGGPKQPKQSSDSEPGNSRGGKKSDDGEGDKQAARPGLGRSAGGMLPLAPTGSFRPNEVLAINLTPAGLKAARARNYKLIELVDLPRFGLKISRLEPPEGQNAISGRNTLLDLVPDTGFALSRVYVPYRMGLGLGLGGPAKTGLKCAADRCFGTGLINWQPRLADCASGIKIGIVDTGYDASHPAFKNLRAVAQEFLPPNAKRVPQHGTAILSVLAGDPQSGTPGLVPNADYHIANAFYADGNGEAMSDTMHILAALHWLEKQGVAVANLSFSGPEDELIQAAVRQLAAAGVVVVAAGGNDGPSAPPSYPAGYKEVIAVTAVDRNRAPYVYANRGPYIDVAAPGVGIWTALPGNREGAQTGTSFAAPYVTAVIAANYPEGVGPSDDPAGPKQRALASLRKNANALSGPGLGAGLVQAAATCGARPGAPAPGSWSSTVHAVSR
jgi:hypothetical protein